MAASESQTASQRMANHSFVQEDAKRAPKLTCYPSFSLKQQPDSSNGDSAKGTDQPASSFRSLKWDPMNSNLQPDTKWWLLQPNFVCPKDITCEQLSALEELEYSEIPASKLLGDEKSISAAYVASEKKSNSLETHWKISSHCSKHENEERTNEVDSSNNNLQQPNREKADISEHWYQNGDLMDGKTFDQLFSKKPEKACFDLETPWLGIEKTEPCWRTADKDELASLVAQKSLRHIENCDLPRPQKVHFCRYPFCCLEALDDNRPLSLDPKLQAGACCTLDFATKSCTSGSMDGRHEISGEVGHYVYGSEKMFSVMQDLPESKHHPESDSSKAELLEALCHSQTRAREAEIAAQKAYNEKEHIVKLFFKQASQVFAYKQWIQMLQLESLFLQLRDKEHQLSSLFPVLPWSPLKGSKLGCGMPKAKKRKCLEHQKCSVCKYAVTFAIGFGLASAGLLLGWTLGWLLPTF